MNMVRLIYASRFSREAGPGDLQEIVDVSREKNRELGITGALCFDPRFFMQCIEGPRGAVNELYNRIVVDERHTDVTLIAYGEIHKRSFAKWSMAYVRIDEKVGPVLLRYSPTSSFDPFSMSGEQALAFAVDVAAAREMAVG